MNPEDLVQHLKNRRQSFLHFRWLLFLWLGASSAWLHLQGQPQGRSFALLGFLLASQGLLWSLPLKAFEGLKVFYAVFLLDLNFMLLGLSYTGQLQPDLLAAIFMGTFVAALGQRMGYAVLGSVVLSALYFGSRARTGEGIEFLSSGELLKLPLLFIASIHSGLLAQEAAGEAAAMNLLSSDRNALNDRLKGTFVQIARFSRDIGAMIDALPFGIVMVDNAGKVSIFNDMAEYTWGLRRQSVIEKPLKELGPVAYLEPLIRKGMENPESDFQLIDIHTNDGKPFQMNLSTYPVLDAQEQAIGTLAVFSPLSYHESVLGHIEDIKSRAGAAAGLAQILEVPGLRLKLPHLKPLAAMAQEAA